MEKDSKIYVAGGRGMVGSAIIRELKKQGYTNVTDGYDKHGIRTNLAIEEDVISYFTSNKFDYIFLAAAMVGGIKANDDSSADFIRFNLEIQTNVMKWAHITDVKKLLFLGSSCIYPKMAPQPIKEEYLLTGPLEETNKAYAVAKIAGITMAQMYRKQYGCDFISAMPTNLYGPNDNFDLNTSHVLPALIRKFAEAKINNSPKVEVWGTGTPRREFLYVDDLAKALVFLMNNYSSEEIVNVGAGRDVSIKELAEMIQSIVGYSGDIVFNDSYPDGTPRKLLDVSRIKNMGWKSETSLFEGISKTYEHFMNYNKHLWR